MSLLDLTDEHARLGKISNNLEKHGEESKTGFTLPLKLRIARPMLVGLMGEEFDRCAWTIGPTNEINGIPSWLRRLLPLKLDGETYVGVKSAIVVGGNLEPEHGQELLFDDCHVSKITIIAMAPGGITELDCHLYLNPGIGSENLLLQEYQEREVAVQMTLGKLRVKVDKAQKDMFNDSSNPPAAATPGDQPQPQSAAEEGETSQEPRDFTSEEINAMSPCDCDPPTIDDPEHSASIVDDALIEVGTPEQERDKAHEREREIARQLCEGRSFKESA
jgi:hypothetical protein